MADREITVRVRFDPAHARPGSQMERDFGPDVRLETTKGLLIGAMTEAAIQAERAGVPHDLLRAAMQELGIGTEGFDCGVMDAVGFGTVTYMGMVARDYPLDHGNVMGLRVDSGESYEITNCWHENLERLLSTGTLTWPIKMRAVGNGSARLIDSRIPMGWLRDR